MLTLLALLIALLGPGPIHIDIGVGGPVMADQTGGGPGHGSSTSGGGPAVDDQTGGGPG